MNVSCHVIQDLLVPYMEESCTDESRAFVEEHLKRCNLCRKTLETYRAPIAGVDVNAVAKAQKPFRKVRRVIRFFVVLSIVLFLMILPVAVYQIYGHIYDFYEADRVFCGLDDSDFINAAKATGVENRTKRMYRTMYYTLQTRNGTADPNASLAELVDEYNALNQIALDYENAVIDFNINNDLITVMIPLILPEDAVPTVIRLAGNRVGVGKYCFTEYMLYPQNIAEENYVALNYANITFDTLDAWPFIGYETWTVKAWAEYEETEVPPTAPIAYEDTGLEIPAGEYVYTRDDGYRRVLTAYEDGTLMVRSEMDHWDTDDFPEFMPSMLGYLYDTAQPCSYFIVKGKRDYELIVRYEKTGIRNRNTIAFLEDGNLMWRDMLYVRVGDSE